jgi:hypothetical protein
MFQTKVVDKINTHIWCSINFSPQNGAVNERMWKKTVQQNRPQIKIRRVRTACWIPKAKDTHSEYVILIAFHYNSGWTNAPQCFITCTLSGLFTLIFFFSWLDWASGPRRPYNRCFKITLKHTTLGRTPLGVWSAPRRLLYSTTHNTNFTFVWPCIVTNFFVIKPTKLN